jgi:hypothetical protein
MATTFSIGNPAATIIVATSTAGSPPTSGTDGLTTNINTPVVRTFLDYTGTVSSGTLRLYTRNGSAWFRGDTYAMTGTDEAVDWAVGAGTEFTFVVEAITQSGGGTVAVSAVGVQS